MDREGSGLAQLTLTQFTERLASDEPVPGGGSASAVAGALGASLLAMVARLSGGRPKYEPYVATHQRALQVAERARPRLLELADQDAAAYARLAAAFKLPKETDDQQRARTEAVRTAAHAASEVPLAMVRECALVLSQAESMSGRSNLNAASDLEVAARLCAAAARGAAANVLVNLPHVGDQRYVGASTAEIEHLLQGVERDVSQIAQRVARVSLREPEST
jgi:methenyltetrahydrofolate cyclohydrolase